MWKLRSLWLAAGLSEDTLWDRMINGMNFTPSRPAYEDMRDGILAAIDAANSSDVVKERCQLWTAFAQFGIGQGADGTESCNFIRCTGTVTESFAVPAGVCSAPTNTAPTVSITSPVAPNTTFEFGAPITFSATVGDADGDSVTTRWYEGATLLFTGTSFTKSDFAAGSHTITVKASDGQAETSASVTVTVNQPSGGGGITLSGRGYKVKGVRNVDLTWSGATGGTVNIFRGTTPITTDNDGFYTDVISGKGSGTFTYKVCEVAPSTTCSATITIVF
jgi:hypothetical protein